MVKTNQLQMITLEELAQRWSKHTGEMYSIPPELQHSWTNYCRVKPHAWYDMERTRKQQLQALGLYETHRVDFYLNNKAPMPNY